MNNELFPLCFPLSCSQYVNFGYHIRYTADIKYRPDNPDVSGASIMTSLWMKYVEYACKASWSMITIGHVEITFFFSYVDFQRYRGAVLWNFVSSYFNNATNRKHFCKKARMDPIFKKLNFGSLSIQTTPKHRCDFQF